MSWPIIKLFTGFPRFKFNNFWLNLFIGVLLSNLMSTIYIILIKRYIYCLVTRFRNSHYIINRFILWYYYSINSNIGTSPVLFIVVTFDFQLIWCFLHSNSPFQLVNTICLLLQFPIKFVNLIHLLFKLLFKFGDYFFLMLWKHFLQRLICCQRFN